MAAATAARIPPWTRWATITRRAALRKRLRAETRGPLGFRCRARVCVGYSLLGEGEERGVRPTVDCPSLMGLSSKDKSLSIPVTAGESGAEMGCLLSSCCGESRPDEGTDTPV